MKFRKILASLIVATMVMTGITGCADEETVMESSVVNNENSTTSKTEETNGVSEEKSEESSEETRVIVDHTGAEVTIPAELDRIVISSIFPLPSVYCLFRNSAEDIVGIHPSSMAAAEN